MLDLQDLKDLALSMTVRFVLPVALAVFVCAKLGLIARERGLIQ